MKTTTKLRQMLSSDRLTVAPFVLNALHAKIAESVGFQAVYMTGAGTAAERVPRVAIPLSVRVCGLATGEKETAACIERFAHPIIENR